jgi:phiKZ-like phage internal head proteins
MRSIRNGFGARSKVALENTDGLSKEAAAAIGAGDKSIPKPTKDGEVPANISNGEDPTLSVAGKDKGDQEPGAKKDIGSSAVKTDGEVPAQQSNGEDPTLSVAKGDEGKPPKIAGTAGALESHGKKPKFTPLQRARIKVALEDAGMSSDEAEAEIRTQEEAAAAPAVAPEGEAAAAAEAGEGGEAAVPPVEGAEAGAGEPPAAEVPPVDAGAEAGTMPPAVAGDPAELAAGDEAAAGAVPGAGGEAALSGGETEVPTGEAGADLGADAGTEVPGVDAGAPAMTPEAGEGEDTIDPVELENARALVARAEGRAPAAPEAGREGRAAEPMEPAGGEEAGGGLPTEVEAEGEMDATSGLEGELLEVADAEKEVDEVAGQVEAGREVVEALESMRETLKIATESGGLDRNGAAVFKLAFEGYMKRLDIPQVEQPHILSLESFGGVSKKISSTQLSMEAIGTALKTVWDKIWKALVAAGQFLAQLADKLTNAAVQMEGRANKLAQQAQSTQGQPTAREIENGQIAEALAIGGRVDVNGIAKLAATAKGMYAAYPEMLKFAQGMAQGFESGELKASLSWPWSNEVLKVAKQRGSEDGLQIYASDVLPGNQEIIFKIASGDRLGDSSAGMDEAQGAGNVPQKLPVLSQPQAGTVAKQVAELAATIKSAKQQLGQSAAVIKQLAALAKKYASMGESGEGEGVSNETSKATLIGLKKALEEPFKEFNIYALRTGNAALNWVDASLKQYGAAPAAAKPAGGEAPAKVPAAA